MSNQAIADFWLWWAENRPRVLAGLHDQDADWVRVFSEKIAAIDPALEWEFGRGREAAHHLAVSATGDPRLRVLAEKWRARGPAPDEAFEFHCSRQRMPSSPMEAAIRFGDLHLDYAGLGFEVTIDDHVQRFHVVCRHPTLDAIPEEHRLRVVYVMLDNLLGEDALETWVGDIAVESSNTECVEVNAQELQSLVDSAPTRWPEHNWVVAQATEPESGQTLVYTGMASAKYLRAPLFDTMCVARLPYAPQDGGMPASEDLARVDGFHRVVEDRLQDEVMVLWRRTGAGERMLWMALMADNGPGRTALEALAEGHPGHVELTFSWDPGWRSLPL